MVDVKPFSGLYYYNKFSKSNNVSKFLNRAFYLNSNTGLNLKTNAADEFNFKLLQKKCDYDAINVKFKAWLEDGALTVSGLPSFYVCSVSYKIAGNIYESKGVFGAFKLPRKEDCEIISVENYDDVEKKFIFDYLNRVNLQISPVFALYEEDEKEIVNLLDNACAGPCCEKFKHLNTIYKVWEVKNADLILRIREYFKKINKLYVINGFAFYNAVVENNSINKGRKIDYILTFFMEKSSEVLAVLPFHRVFSMNMFDLQECLNKFGTYFDYFELRSLSAMRSKMFSLKRENKTVFGFYAEESFGVLVLKDDFKFGEEFDKFKHVRNLDAFIVNELIVSKLLNLSSVDVQCTSSALEAKSAVDRGDGCLALFLNSERLTDLIEFSHSGEKMPYKFAGFFPNSLDGLVLYSMYD